ncbi:hypothetical protein LPW11_06130 [Geomonas sp. RF6]|uniref:hypothetical protein n=1 Tax=Geomonas sp. RF6 TaxID=2897342 RepID=UPI001E582D25|nr:hypothetical protein [Geomonas sp. RF6]UFS71768.1 hypothetical protein LPW11_06130 [Geomonas sp. RF6]
MAEYILNTNIGEVPVIKPRRLDGYYGTIFVSYDRNIAFKVFKKGDSAFDRLARLYTFRSEVAAYTKITADNLLGRHVPKFYGTLEVSNVVSSIEVLPDFNDTVAYCMEFIDAPFFGVVNDSKAEATILNFKAVGVDYVKDADFAIVNGVYKFIDFALIGVREELQKGEWYLLSDESKLQKLLAAFPFLAEIPKHYYVSENSYDY